MAPVRSFVPFVTTIAFVLALGGCRTPQSLCQEYVDSINAMADRCGFGGPPFTVVHPTTGETGCGIVQQIRDPEPIVEGCIPWADGIDTPEECAEVDSLPSFCSAGAFQIVE